MLRVCFRNPGGGGGGRQRGFRLCNLDYRISLPYDEGCDDVRYDDTTAPLLAARGERDGKIALQRVIDLPCDVRGVVAS
jgi:hypothetical protein